MPGDLGQSDPTDLPIQVDRMVAKIEDNLLAIAHAAGRTGEAEIVLEQVREWAREASRRGRSET